MRPKLVRNRENVGLGIGATDVDRRELRSATAGAMVVLSLSKGVAGGVQRGEGVGGATGVGLRGGKERGQ